MGDRATILHFNGETWAAEPNPLERFADSLAPAVYESRLWGVGGDAQDVYAVGLRILHKSDQEWREVIHPNLPDSEGLYTAVAEVATGAFFGGSHFTGYGEQPRLIQFVEGRWKVLTGQLQGFRTGIFDGKAQGDGSVLFWSDLGDVVHIADGSVRTFRFEGFAEVRAAVAVGRYLYLAGALQDTAVVARIPL